MMGEVIFIVFWYKIHINICRIIRNNTSCHVIGLCLSLGFEFHFAMFKIQVWIMSSPPWHFFPLGKNLAVDFCRKDPKRVSLGLTKYFFKGYIRSTVSIYIQLILKDWASESNSSERERERVTHGISYCVATGLKPIQYNYTTAFWLNSDSCRANECWLFGHFAMAVVVANLAGEVMIKVSPIPGSLLDVKKEVTHVVNLPC